MAAIWNTRVAVIANLEADSEEQALATLRKALTRAGFEIFDGDAFQAETGTTTTELPLTVRLNR